MVRFYASGMTDLTEPCEIASFYCITKRPNRKLMPEKDICTSTLAGAEDA